MFFTHLGRIVAVLALLLGISLMASGLAIATGAQMPFEAELARYAPWARSSGEAFYRGMYAVLFAIALGILTDISRSVRPDYD